MAIPQAELESILHKTVAVFNRLRSPQALTKAIYVSPEAVTIEFSGSLCFECGDVEKYIVDFQKDFKVFVDYLELLPGKTKETAPHGFQVNFFIKHR